MKWGYDDIILGFGAMLLGFGIVYLPNVYALAGIVVGSGTILVYVIKISRDQILEVLEEKSQVVTKE